MTKHSYNHIWSDGICVYVSSRVTNPATGKIALLFADLFILSGAIVGIETWLPGLIIISIIFLFFLSKYTLWSFFGKENLIINVKSFSYQHDYGLFKPSYVSKILDNRLVVQASDVSNNKIDKLLRLSFVSYGKLDLIPREIYYMSVFFLEDEAVYLNSLINQLYVDQLQEDYEFPVIYLN